MMKATDSRFPANLGLRRRSMLGRAPDRRITKQSVDSVGVVVVDVLAEKLPKVVLVQDDHVIQQLSASAADPSLGNPILPRAPKGRSLRLDSKILDRLSDAF
jgi:hypothetical protein